MVEPNQRLRHSPGKTQRKTMRRTSKTKYSSNCGVHEIPCLVPCTDELHALCQRGALTEKHSMYVTQCIGAKKSNANKSRNFGGLLHFLFRGAGRSPPEYKPPDSVSCADSSSKLGRINASIVSNRYNMRCDAGPIRSGSLAQDRRLTRRRMV